MKSRAMVVGALALVGCAHEVVNAPIDAPVATVAAAHSEDVPPPDAPHPAVMKLSAGPGVTLMAEQFYALVKDRKVMDRTIPYEARVAIAEKVLGPGTPISEPTLEGVSWIGLGTRSMIAPMSCMEFVVATGANGGMTFTQRNADHKRCGLPYVNDPTKPYYGPSTRRTVTRLEETLGVAGTLAPIAAEAHARSMLGLPDGRANGELLWNGLGPRGKDAPFSCRVLHLGKVPRIEEAPLIDCDLSWPMPGMTSFERAPDEPAVSKEAKLAECAQKCSTSEICMIDQRVPYMASMRIEADGTHARFADGQPAKTELIASCVPIPATCTSVTSACFFPPPPLALPGYSATPALPQPTMNGPCPRDGHSGRSFLTTPRNHILCSSRIGGPPPPPPPPPPAASSTPLKPSPPQTRGASPLDLKVLW